LSREQQTGFDQYRFTSERWWGEIRELLDGPLMIVPTPYLRVAICPGTPYTDDRRFRGVLNVCLEDNRGIGRIRELVVADLSKFGLEPGDLPPEVSF